MKSKSPIPPKLAQRFLHWFLRDDLSEEVEGDLEELFYTQSEDGSQLKAKLNYWYQVLSYLRPFAIRKSKQVHLNYYTMFRHNFLLTYRSFKRYKMSFFINLTGLSTGLACALLIYLWVNDELSVDKFHEKDKRLYHVMMHYHVDGVVSTGSSTPGLLAETLVEEIPEVENAVFSRVVRESKTLSTNNDAIKAMGQYASPDYFNVFSYQILQGDKNAILTDKNAIVLSESLAIKLFKTTENILGKLVEFQHQKSYQVTGVFEDIPVNSSIQFDFVLSFEEYKEVNSLLTNWNFSSGDTYVVLKEGADMGRFNDKIANVATVRQENQNPSTLSIRRYSDGYLYSNYENGKPVGGRIEYVKLFSLIAIFILSIACINFMNLSTARASRKTKEVGVKKAMGAGRKGLIFQYLSESLLMTLIAVIVAMLLVFIFLPQFNHITGKQLVLNFDKNLVVSILSIATFTGILAGSYPALYLSGFNPITVLKGKLNSSVGEIWTRKGLVTFQFTLSIILIVGVFIIYKQIGYLQTKNLGYNRDNIIHFDIEGKVSDNLETFLAEINNLPGIIKASSIAQTVAGGRLNRFIIETWEGETDNKIAFEARWVNYDLIETLGIQMAVGRSFSREYSAEGSKIILNEAAIEFMQLENPVGKIVTIQGTELEIIGVTKNFHFESLHTQVTPLFFALQPTWTQKVIAKIQAGKEQETIEKLQAFHTTFNPGFPFDYKFLDEEYQAQYAAEQRVATLSKYFAGLAILISCLGLFGLAAFTVERRLKEIGIRKVLGASIFSIIGLLSGDFTKMVLTAIVIALPTSFILAQQWLGSFAFNIELKWWYFAGAGVLALLIAWLTVSLLTVKAAQINPVKCLKDE
ncbi:MAG: ABC transporter permease [Bacteroidota bacterium]